MSNQFPAFGKLVATSFQTIAKNASVFVTDIDPDALCAIYLAAFPEGENPRFKERTEHDCSCCKQFIRRAGSAVAVDANGTIATVWDEAVTKAPYPYNVVAETMRNAVSSARIRDLYRVGQTETSFGAEITRSSDKVTGDALTWNHFHTGHIPNNLRVSSPGEVCGQYRTTVQVFERGLAELSTEAVETTLDLIKTGNLYRGEEHKAAVVEFQKAQKKYSQLDASARSTFVWVNAHGPAARFRNTVIGTLVQDLSEGRDVEASVSSFETKVAPTNYKRTTAVITPGMVKKAMETIAELDLEPALERRFATIGDISVNDVKWVDGGARPLMKGGIGDVLLQHATAANPKSAGDDEKRAEEIRIDDFMTRIVPEATGMEVLFKGQHVGNLVSLTAPVHPEPRQLFKWNNDFAWSYNGNVADSIAERVKKAGGKVEGATLRVSLSWFNFDDLDLHIIEPRGRGAHVLNEIYYGSKRGWTGGVLDVDMNAGGGHTREAVENIVWMQAMPNGAYQVVVNNFSKRESTDPGFVVEIENGGKVSHFSYNKAVRNQQNVHVCTLSMNAGVIQSVEPGDPAITAANLSQEKWGLRTEQYCKVNAVTLSPNFWGGSTVGNKHFIFLLDGCKCDEATRGIYNEFIHSRLEPHRKVFEIIGDKTKCQPTEGGLSGLGFSSTKKDTVTIKVNQGRKQRLFNVKFGN